MNDKIDQATIDPLDRLLEDKKPSSSGTAIAVLALLIAFVAVAASGWQWQQQRTAGPLEDSQRASLQQLEGAQRQLANTVASIEEQLATAESPLDPEEVSRLGVQLKAVESRLEGIRSQSGEQQSSVSALQGGVRSLEQRLSGVESGLVNVAANSQNSNEELDIAEIDYLLRVASERLQLFSDPLAADLALQAADVQVEALNDPMFLSVRQRIADARRSLAAVEKIDPIALSARLTGIQEKIPTLPLPGEVIEQAEPVLAQDAGWWESFKHSMSSLVTVRRRVPEEQTMLSLEDKDYLRQGLWLQIESARLALMRNDAGTYQASLQRFSTTLEQYFQNDAPSVEAVLTETVDLASVNVVAAMPDISGPWTQLRRLRDSRRLLQSARPLENTVVDE